MKIRLKSTKLVDENKKPIMFFHTTPCEKIEHFLPLSHFGTKKAADMRSMHFVYQALGIPEPEVLPKDIPFHFLKKLSQQKNVPHLQTHSVYLAIKSPVCIPDLNHHSLEQYYHWFFRQYVPKSHYLSGSERCEGDVVGAARIKYKSVLSDFIFRDPFTQSKENLEKELSAESFYSIPTKLSIQKSVPSFLFPVISKIDRNLYSLSEKVALQRMMRYLEGEGHDGFVYKNEYEDKGKNSYIIFRPEQVFDQFESNTEHVIPEKTIEQKSFLYDVEVKFFANHQMLSPNQRIQRHLKNLKKNKERV